MDLEANPNSIETVFKVLHAPILNSIEVSQGFARVPNSNVLVSGRGESRTLTLMGTYMTVAEGRQPECLFTAYRSSALEEQMLETQYATLA